MTRYLTEEEIVAINYYQIKRFSPGEIFGVKEPTALQDCVEQPKQEMFGKALYPTLFNKAAVLFEMLINKHCFHNANKRTASMSLYTFLRLNGKRLTASNEELVTISVAIAEQKGEGRLSREDIAGWIEKHSESWAADK